MALRMRAKPIYGLAVQNLCNMTYKLAFNTLRSSMSSDRLPLSQANHYFAAFFMLALVPAVLGPTLVELAGRTDAALRDVSLVFSMRSLGYLCSARLIGAVYDTRAGHPVMAIALVCTAILAISIPFLTTFWVLAASILLIGISGAFVDLGGNILLVRVFRTRPGPILNGLHFSFGMGAFAAPLLVAFALATTGAGVNAYWMIGLISLPVAAWIFRVESPELPPVRREANEEKANLSTSIFFIVLFFFLYGGAEISFGGWIHTYGVERNFMDETSAAYLTSGFWGAFTMGRLFAIPLAVRFRPQHLILTQFTGSIIALAILLLTPSSMLLTWVCTLTIGLGMSSIFPLMMAFLEPFTAGSGRLTSWFFVGASSGSMCIPWLIGQFIEPLGPQVFVGTVLFCLIGGLGIVIIMSLRTF